MDFPIKEHKSRFTTIAVFFGGPCTKDIVFGGLCWGPLTHGNYQIELPQHGDIYKYIHKKLSACTLTHIHIYTIHMHILIGERMVSLCC